MKFLFVTLLCIAPTVAHATDIWLGAIDPISGANRAPRMDFRDLIHPDAPWQQAALKVKVMQVITQFIADAPDELLIATFDDLKRRGIALAVESLMLSGDFSCGGGIEGFAARGQMAALVARVKALGGTLDYIAMDEPLWYGHHFAGPNACRFSIPELARIIAWNVAGIRRSFPDVKVGDTEPVPAANPSAWSDEIVEWAAAYKAATGSNLAFLHADIDWQGAWAPALRTLRARMHAAGIKFGIIYNGDPSDQTGVQWTHRAEQRFASVECDPTLMPDQAILQTWHEHPLHMLPETKAGTMTNLVLRYGARETILSLNRDASRLAGRLTDASGVPVSDAPIDCSAIDRGFPGNNTVNLGSAITNAKGEFSLHLKGTTITQALGFRGEFPGTAGYRLATAELPQSPTQKR
jgi:hypothetical protein